MEAISPAPWMPLEQRKHFPSSELLPFSFASSHLPCVGWCLLAGRHFQPSDGCAEETQPVFCGAFWIGPSVHSEGLGDWLKSNWLQTFKIRFKRYIIKVRFTKGLTLSLLYSFYSFYLFQLYKIILNLVSTSPFSPWNLYVIYKVYENKILVREEGGRKTGHIWILVLILHPRRESCLMF